MQRHKVRKSLQCLKKLGAGQGEQTRGVDVSPWRHYKEAPSTTSDCMFLSQRQRKQKRMQNQELHAFFFCMCKYNTTCIKR